MNTKEKLNYFTSKMSLPFFMKNCVKLELLDKDINRYIKRELKGEKNLQFSSQDLRSYVLALEKVHKALNKKISFTEFNKHLEKRYTKVDSKILREETKLLGQYIASARICQMLLSTNNYWASVVRMVECQYEQEKENSDEIFNHEILSALLEVY